MPEDTKRFAFGRNWARYQSLLTEERILAAEESLRKLLLLRSLEGKSFLDIGSGSGLFSLAARRLGATVYSFDFDKDSVACTLALREKYFPGDDGWQIDQGSILESDYIESLPKMDIVYSWGVLHHTGDMWTALDLAAKPLRQDGLLAIAIYNDQGIKSTIWKKIKAFYCSGSFGKRVCQLVFLPLFFFARILIDLSELKNPLKSFREYDKDGRGMAILTDWLDWLGGYPFEVASPEEIVDFYRDSGFALIKLRTVGGKHGCNEYLLQRVDIDRHSR